MCHYAECSVLLNVVLSVIMLNVIMLSVVAPTKLKWVICDTQHKKLRMNLLCHYADGHIQFIVMLNVIMLSVVRAGELTISLIDGTSSFAGGTIITGVNVIKLFSSL